MTKSLVLILFVFVLQSCSSIPKEEAQLEISANNEAMVSIYDQETDKIFDLGKTPLKITTSELRERTAKSPWIYLQINAQGFVPENILVPSELRSSQKIRIALKKVEWWNDPSHALSSQIVQQVGRNFQDIYRSIRQGKNDDALNLTDKLITEYPQASILYDIKGSLYLIKGSKAEAISAYERSLQISSDNPETIKLLDQLKKGIFKQ